MKKYLFIILLFVFAIQESFAKLIIPKIIGSNMVLQQGEPVAVWGWANPGETILVKFQNQVKKVICDDGGNWKVMLSPMKASISPEQMEINARAESIKLNNILVGEVWLCSGQSNMEFAMRKISKLSPPPGTDWPVDELEKANNSQIRIFLVERKKMQPDSAHSGWAVAQGDALRNFSAVGYFFAKELQKRLGVPVGIISAAIPGSRIEPWMPAEAIKMQAFFKLNKNSPVGKIDGDPGKFYNSMIVPLIPYTLKGVLWYQGESNCFLNERIQYSYKMKSLIDFWRGQWRNPKMPFYYVQIAPYYYSKATDREYTVYSEPEFWEAQAAVLKLANTAMIATLDLNDDPNDLHPVNKWDIGKRLANAALIKTYHKGNGVPMGPIFKRIMRRGNSLVLEFKYSDGGLVSKGNKALKGFEIENDSGVFTEAKAVIKNNKIWLSSKGIKNPKTVRYAWREDAPATLFNKQGLPALPFRTSGSVIKEFK